MKKCIIKTNKGSLFIELYDSETPLTVQNFIKLAESGFYNGIKFHRVIPGFVSLVGCPTGDGTGGPGWNIPCETSNPNQFHDRGVLSMAHSGKNTGGSQFFICHSRRSVVNLDGKHTCFGRVVQGLETLDQIRIGDEILEIKF